MINWIERGKKGPWPTLRCSRCISQSVYTISLITKFIQTYSVWYVILSRETGVVHRITH